MKVAFGESSVVFVVMMTAKENNNNNICLASGGNFLLNYLYFLMWLNVSLAGNKKKIICHHVITLSLVDLPF